MSTPVRVLGFAAAVLFLAGCEVVPLTPDGSNPPPAAADTQPPAAAIGLVTTLIQAAVEDTIALGTDGNLTTRSLEPRAPTSVTRSVSLDARNGSIDKFRDASGTFTLTPSEEAFVPSWPTGITGSKVVTLTISLSSQVGYTDPVSGWTATLSSGTISVSLDLQWTKSDATSTPARATTIATVSTPSGGISLSGRSSKSGETDRIWSLSGTRQLTLKTERTDGQSNTSSTTTVTAGTALWTAVIDGRTTTVWNRSDKDTMAVTSGSTALFSGAISTLPSRLGVHNDPQIY